MRLLALTALALTLSAATASGAARAPGGSLSIVGGRGAIQVTGTKALIGTIEKGSLKITDLTPNDGSSPFVNGVPRGKEVWLRGQNIRFRILKGHYKIVARGDGISISAYGSGTAVLDGDPDQGGATGFFAVGGATCVGTDTAGCAPLPAESTKASFGVKEGKDASAPSSQSVKIQP